MLRILIKDDTLFLEQKGMKGMNNEKTGKMIQQLRKEKGMTQLILADNLGITDRAVSKWERGKSFPDVSMLQPLSEVLGVSVRELLEGERNQPVDFEEELQGQIARLLDERMADGSVTIIYGSNYILLYSVLLLSEG